ncbi:MAG: SAM-dependent chlorinase/fluorinase [Candidatus Moraniibacteriota bacterium]|nr:MAG: SAM-dependent chlorinase/fluorinase [Candidatus Moranbacteria bacterium]
MNKKNVVIITDCKDVAFNEMRRIVLNECFKLGVKDVEVELVCVAEFSLINAAFLTRLMADYYFEDTVFSVVINPQKHRSARIYGELNNGIKFFSANTGALSWVLKDFGYKTLYEVHDPGFVSFGGKYVHAPNVAKLVAGEPLNSFGKPFDAEQLISLDISTGTIVHIDNFGLLKMMGETPRFKEGQRFKIFINSEEKFEAKFSNRMMTQDDKDWVLYAGSSIHSLPELGTVRYSEGYKEFYIKIGDRVTWTTIDY